MTRKKGLGKGLSALIPGAPAPGAEEEFFYCPVEAISPNPFQPRQTLSEAELEDLARSVRETGILTPLLVTRAAEGYQLIAGERRWRAALKAGLERVPVVMRDVASGRWLELALVENLHRKDLNPIEEALAYQRLLEEPGQTQESVARKVGKDRTTISNLLRLLKLPRSIQQDILDGRLSMGHARVLAGIKSPRDQVSVRDRIVQKGLSVRQAEALARALHGRSGRASPREDPYLRSLADSLKRTLGTKVEIRRRGRKGQIILYFYSDEELDRLLEQLT